MTAPDLKPCPFCGGDKNMICKTDYDGWDSYAVSCRYPECHGSIFTLGYGYFATEVEAIAAWNTRAVDHAAIRINKQEKTE
jgi:Lar family restriction alleviation protein